MSITDEDAALQAISTFTELSQAQQDAYVRIANIVASDEPFIDIHELFALYDTLYFRSLLSSRVEVFWSTRLTLCAGICELVKDALNGNRYTKIRLKLSEPLLKYRPRNDVVDTLLHESIHAYFFITTSWRHSRGDDGSGHGPGFLLLADALNNHGGYGISVYHTFHDEVDSYRTHIWQCNGPCKGIAPFFGLVKRSMNRAPGKGDSWWDQHERECGGKFVKIAEPKLSKNQVAKMSVAKRAGMQKNKIDRWLAAPPQKNKHETGEGSQTFTKRSRSASPESSDSRKQSLEVCPICMTELDTRDVNAHLDQKHPS